MKNLKKAAAAILLAGFVFSGSFAEAKTEKKTRSNQQRRVFSEAIVTANPATGQPPLHLMVTVRGISYGVDASSTAARNIVRRYNGRADFSEFEVGDKLRIWGTLDNTSTPGTITATKIRDNSIFKLGSSLKGTITAISDDLVENGENDYQQFTLETRNRGTQTVKVYGTTSIKYRGAAKTFADLDQGDTVEVKGIWNKNTLIVYNTTRVKIKVAADGI